ncbi:MAG: Gfo/Idh/MocA family oxidoreductase [Elusimicrobiota bacterium]
MVDKMIRVGVIGCGKISGIYFKNIKTYSFLEVAACADLNMAAAQNAAQAYAIPKACTPQELLADPSIDIVLNLTVPKAHGEIAFAAVNSGKSVYNEKPLTVSREDGKALLKLAKQKKVLIGCAPDTVLGGGIQTCRKLIDDGVIGSPVGATAFMLGHGPEGWHPNPEFFYQVGGGPMFDMAPYYLTTLVTLLGPVVSVIAKAKITFPERTITSQPKAGQKIVVEIPTHIVTILNFVNGAVGTLITSFDVWKSTLPRIEIYGSEGSMLVPDPNTFGGPISIFKPGDKEWTPKELTHGYQVNSRGLGVADMAYALLNKKHKHRANGKIAYHVLDIMHAAHESSEKGKVVKLKSQCDRPLPMPMTLEPGKFEI